MPKSERLLYTLAFNRSASTLFMIFHKTPPKLRIRMRTARRVFRRPPNMLKTPYTYAKSEGYPREVRRPPPGFRGAAPERTIPARGVDDPPRGADVPPVMGGRSTPGCGLSAPGALPRNREADGRRAANTPRTLHTCTAFWHYLATDRKRVAPFAYVYGV